MENAAVSDLNQFDQHRRRGSGKVSVNFWRSPFESLGVTGHCLGLALRYRQIQTVLLLLNDVPVVLDIVG